MIFFQFEDNPPGLPGAAGVKAAFFAHGSICARAAPYYSANKEPPLFHVDRKPGAQYGDQVWKI
jgi:hypothetical protein